MITLAFWAGVICCLCGAPLLGACLITGSLTLAFAIVILN